MWQVVLVAALGSGVAEGLMAELLEDDRVLFRFQELKDIVKIEMEAVTLISQEVLELLCMVSCGGLLPMELHSRAIHCSCISAAYIDKRIFAATDRRPWCLAKDNIKDNLRDLVEGDKPEDDETSLQLWKLMKMGWPIERCEEVVLHLQLLPWSSIGAEQGHTAAAVIKKQHQEIHEDQLCCRSFLYQLRPLLAEPEENAALATYQKQMEGVLAKAPDKFTGRQVFCKLQCSRQRNCRLVPSDTSHSLTELQSCNPMLKSTMLCLLRRGWHMRCRPTQPERTNGRRPKLLRWNCRSDKTCLCTGLSSRSRRHILEGWQLAGWIPPKGTSFREWFMQCLKDMQVS